MKFYSPISLLRLTSHPTSLQGTTVYYNLNDKAIYYHDGTEWVSLRPHTGTQGSIFFAGSDGRPNEDNANLFWDNANNRLGIGTNMPEGFLDVKTYGTTFRVNNYTMSADVNTTGGWARAFVLRNRAQGKEAQTAAFGSLDGTAYIATGYDGSSGSTGYQSKRIYISREGDVGIGYNFLLPDTKLAVKNDGDNSNIMQLVNKSGKTLYKFRDYPVLDINDPNGNANISINTSSTNAGYIKASNHLIFDVLNNKYIYNRIAGKDILTIKYTGETVFWPGDSNQNTTKITSGGTFITAGLNFTSNSTTDTSYVNAYNASERQRIYIYNSQSPGVTLHINGPINIGAYESSATYLLYIRNLYSQYVRKGVIKFKLGENGVPEGGQYVPNWIQSEYYSNSPMELWLGGVDYNNGSPILKLDLQSDPGTSQFTGRVKGLDAQNPDEFVTKSQLDAITPGLWSENPNDNTEIYYDGGNVGIGVQDPNHKFHVVGNTRLDGTTYIGNNNFIKLYKGSNGYLTLEAPHTSVISGSLNVMNASGSVSATEILEKVIRLKNASGDVMLSFDSGLKKYWFDGKLDFGKNNNGATSTLFRFETDASLSDGLVISTYNKSIYYVLNNLSSYVAFTSNPYSMPSDSVKIHSNGITVGSTSINDGSISASSLLTTTLNADKLDLYGGMPVAKDRTIISDANGNAYWGYPIGSRVTLSNVSSYIHNNIPNTFTEISSDVTITSYTWKTGDQKYIHNTNTSSSISVSFTGVNIERNGGSSTITIPPDGIAHFIVKNSNTIILLT